MCSGNGQCLESTGACLCNRYFAGPGCAISCPRNASGIVCSGHGTCDDGVSGTGMCVCFAGFGGSTCSSTCEAESTCSGHGICNSDLTCSCDFDAYSGYWAGPWCNVCDVSAAGPTCTSLCLVDGNNVTCSGNGKCTPSGCACSSSAVGGYWSGALCDVCQAGYSGATCAAQCPGGACNPCNGHGVCSDGTSGNNTCSCVGNWAAPDCGTCVTGYYGLDCTLVCPDCSSSGRCNDGPLGDGTCVCKKQYVRDSTGACTVCAPGYFGPSCAACPISLLNGQPCGLHGMCALAADGVTGTCNCDLGYGGAACDLQCPVDVTTCGHGTCVGESNCSCSGNWSQSSISSSCSFCLRGNYGPTCNESCPDCNHGTCRDGTNGDGSCVCDFGWFGARCNSECPGGAANPCSGHGLCSAVNGTCTCYNDTANGFFVGAVCDTCLAAYNSTTCAVACPTTGGVICNGRGNCFNGMCTMCAALPNDRSPYFCGGGCNVSGRDCFHFLSNCASGFYGTNCANRCPGPGICNGNGFCSPDNGTCFCDSGYFGTGCTSFCANLDVGNATRVFCSGHGVCQAGACQCQYGYYDSACSSIGPGGLGNICSNHGLLQTDGTCTCTYGYGGGTCSARCPTTSSGLICNNHGTCSALSGACICDTSAVLGYFAGTSCEDCARGYGGGASCLQKCDPAHAVTTIGTQCQCVAG